MPNVKDEVKRDIKEICKSWARKDGKQISIIQATSLYIDEQKVDIRLYERSIKAAIFRIKKAEQLKDEFKKLKTNKGEIK